MSVAVAPPRSRTRAAWAVRVYLPACSIALLAVLLVAYGWATEWDGASFVDSATALRVAEAALTGESEPVGKTPAPLAEAWRIVARSAVRSWSSILP